MQVNLYVHDSEMLFHLPYFVTVFVYKQRKLTLESKYL